MPSSATRKRSSAGSLVLSLVIHCSVIASLVWIGVKARNLFLSPVQPQSVARLAISGGSHKIRIVLPASETAAHVPEPDRNADSSKKTIIPMLIPPVEKSGGGSTPTPHHGDGSAQALVGNGADSQDLHPAFPVFAPHPPIHNRQWLPTGEMKVVVDVDVDAQGQVVSEKLVKGIGNPIDQIVLEIAKTWRFQPATINGKPVPTEAELIFPFDQNYPIAAS